MMQVCNESARLLFLGAEQGSKNLVQEFIESGNNVNSLDSHNNTALHYAAANDHVEVIHYLLNNGASVDAENSLSWTPLMQASRHGHLASVLTLLEARAEVNKKNKYGITALSLAVVSGNVAVVRVLLNADADCDITTTPPEHINPLMVAALHGKDTIVTLLLDKGVSVNKAANRTKLTPLMYSVIGGNGSTVELLVNNGADANTFNSFDQLPIEIASTSNLVDIFKFLDPITNKPGVTDILDAIRYNDINLLHQTIKKDPSKINIQSKEGGTPLILASILGHKHIVEFLLKNGAAINAKDKRNGCSALMHAVYHRQSEIAQLLIDSGADVNMVSNHGYTLADFANESNDVNILKLYFRSQMPEFTDLSQQQLVGTPKSGFRQWINKLSSRFSKPKIAASVEESPEDTEDMPSMTPLQYYPLLHDHTHTSRFGKRSINTASNLRSFASVNNKSDFINKQIQQGVKVVPKQAKFNSSNYSKLLEGAAKKNWVKLFSEEELKKYQEERMKKAELSHEKIISERENFLLSQGSCSTKSKLSSDKTIYTQRSKQGQSESESYTLEGSGSGTSRNKRMSSALSKLTVSLGDGKLKGILEKLALDNYNTIFEDEEVDLQSFVELSEDDLEVIGIESIQDKEKIIAAISSLKRKMIY